MIETLSAWAASKAAGLARTGLAVAGAILIPVCIGQAIHIHGWPLFGGGLKAEVAALDKAINEPVTGYIAQLAVARANIAHLGRGLDRCNASVAALEAIGKAREAAAQKRVDGLLAQLRSFNNRRAAVGAIEATNAQCPTVDRIFETGFGP